VTGATPSINRSGTSSLFASCTIRSAIFRRSPSDRPSRLRSSWSVDPIEATYSGSRSGAFCPARRAQLVRIPPGSSVQTLTPNGATSIARASLKQPTGPLGRVIRRVAGDRHAAADRRHLKDVAAPLLAHDRYRGARCVNHALDPRVRAAQ
jgi:hypothetical protein